MTTRRVFIRQAGLSGIGLATGLPFRSIRSLSARDHLKRHALLNEPIVGLEFGSSKFYAAVGARMADGMIRVLGLGEASYRVENQTPTLTPLLHHLCTALWTAQEASKTMIRKAHLAVDCRSVVGNGIALLRTLNVETGDIAFRTIPSATAVLSAAEEYSGALVIDLGALQTGQTAFLNGEIIDYGTQSGGGFHVTQDLANHLQIPWADAERLKLENRASLTGRDSPVKTLGNIIAVRVRAILERTKARLISKGVRLNDLLTGIHLTGGGAAQPGVTELANEVFGLPACVASAKGFVWGDGVVERAPYSCAIGLLKLCAPDGEEKSQRRYFGLVPTEE
jgi:cell division ATPase FtsA